MSNTNAKKPAAKVDPKKANLPANVDPIVPLPDWKKEADDAFKEYASGAKAVNNSEQHLTYAIMAYCASLHQTGVTEAKLADIMPKRGSENAQNAPITNYFRKKCEAEFGVVRVTKKALGNLDHTAREKTHDTSAERSPQMFGRAFGLAYLFERDGVTYTNFDRKLGVFKVRPRLLVEGDAIDDKIAYYGRMVNVPSVPLDGLSIYYVTTDAKGATTPRDVKASLAHYRLCNKPEGIKRNTGGTQAATPAASTKAQDAANSKKAAAMLIAKAPIGEKSDMVTLEVALEIAKHHFCDLADGPITYRSEASTKAWNYISEIQDRATRSRLDPNWETGPDVITGPAAKNAKKVA